MDWEWPAIVNVLRKYSLVPSKPSGKVKLICGGQ